MARSLPYATGDVVAVPLRDEGFALGVVARADGKGIALGYFFGQRVDTLDNVAGPFDLEPGNASKICRFGDRGIIKGLWQVVGRVAEWDPEQWPVPTFCRNGEVLVQYDDQTLKIVSELKSSPQGCKDLPEDGLEGSGFVEIKLTRLLEAQNR
ncbi:immunity 26/phosphotriesterase HocA family protein [Actinocorallia sp. A-T 12471]|uniref:immunity 26/phosphotriesterase HocA family protein n=1 Tax=Actinocorallia sp. A-T 12471 TaxID=3089813 RepID=UPI0029CE2738|nr:immunity 26/phosphotriesterase HocA family protein [Actinocorallia sp. A-T 12471]MDX6740734.1 immunity 26/phosphotriesterase HocA family protein [Actinocorallia sp. A-T 12471]